MPLKLLSVLTVPSFMTIYVFGDLNVHLNLLVYSYICESKDSGDLYKYNIYVHPEGLVSYWLTGPLRLKYLTLP
jgi:hypothetical protein